MPHFLPVYFDAFSIFEVVTLKSQISILDSGIYLRPYVPVFLKEGVGTGTIRIGESADLVGLVRKPKKKTISVEQAMLALIAEQPEKRKKMASSYGEPQLPDYVNVENGKLVFLNYCGKCHGADGQGPTAKNNNNGKGIGPYGAHQPYLYLKVLPLNHNFAGGTTPEFAERSAFGVHPTVPDMSPAATLSQFQWADVQGYVAQFARPE